MERLTERINGKLKLKKQFPTTADTIDVLSDRLELFEDAEEQGRIVQVVRCKDCIFLNKDIAGYGNEHPCRLHSSEVMTCWKQPEQYCSSGEEAETALFKAE